MALAGTDSLVTPSTKMKALLTPANRGVASWDGGSEVAPAGALGAELIGAFKRLIENPVMMVV